MFSAFIVVLCSNIKGIKFKSNNKNRGVFSTPKKRYIYINIILCIITHSYTIARYICSLVHINADNFIKMPIGGRKHTQMYWSWYYYYYIMMTKCMHHMISFTSMLAPSLPSYLCSLPPLLAHSLTHPLTGK